MLNNLTAWIAAERDHQRKPVTRTHRLDDGTQLLLTLPQWRWHQFDRNADGVNGQPTDAEVAELFDHVVELSRINASAFGGLHPAKLVEERLCDLLDAWHHRFGAGPGPDNFGRHRPANTNSRPRAIDRVLHGQPARWHWLTAAEGGPANQAMRRSPVSD
ncbi:MAG: hypothetical protein AAF656_02385 [Planctomycetota bacterium]